MQPEKDQYFIFTDGELSLIRNTFADNDELMYAIRNVMLQFPLSDGQKATLSVGLTPAVLAVLKKRILPEINGSFPLGQLPSILTTFTENLKVLSPDEMGIHFAAKQLEIDYLAQRFEEMEHGVTPSKPITLSEMSLLTDKSIEEQFINMTAYLFLLGYIDPMLGMIKNIAGQANETPEEQKKRLTRDSSK